MKIALGSDHAGFELKEEIKKFLEKTGYECKDFGCFSSESCDYPDYALEVAKAVAKNDADRGILVCGTGIGMSIAANKVHGVHAAVCNSVELAALSRRHNDANILCLGARVLDKEDALEIVKTFLETEFEGGRHMRRIKKIAEIEKIK